MPESECKHCPHPTGTSTTTLMTINNTGTTDVRCCRCGLYGVEHWRESEKRIKGHGKYATRTVRTVESLLWFSSWELTTSHNEGVDGDGYQWITINGNTVHARSSS